MVRRFLRRHYGRRIATHPRFSRELVVVLTVAVAAGGAFLFLRSDNSPGRTAERALEADIDDASATCDDGEWTVGLEFDCLVELRDELPMQFDATVTTDQAVLIIDATPSQFAERVIEGQVSEQLGAPLDASCVPFDDWDDLLATFDCVGVREDGPDLDLIASIESVDNIEVRETREVDAEELEVILTDVVRRLNNQRADLFTSDVNCPPTPARLSFRRTVPCSYVSKQTGEVVHLLVFAPPVEGGYGAGYKVVPTP